MSVALWHLADQDVYTSLRHVAHPALDPGISAVEALEKLQGWPRAQKAGKGWGPGGACTEARTSRSTGCCAGGHIAGCRLSAIGRYRCKVLVASPVSRRRSADGRCIDQHVRGHIHEA